MHNTSHTFASAIRLAMLSLFLFCAAATPSFAAAAPAQADIVENGSFEIGPSGSQVIVVSQGSQAITGWTVVGGDIDYVGSYWEHAHEAISLDLNATTSAGGVSQVITTEVGKWYQLKFALSGNPLGIEKVKFLNVNAGPVFEAYSFDTTGQTLTKMGWVEKTLWFQATATQSELLFQSASPPGAHGPALDYVRVFDYDFSLQADSSVSGDQVMVCALGATPNANVLLAYSLVGPGPIITPFGDLLVSHPYSKISFPQSGSNGNSCKNVNVPTQVFGQTVWLHAFDTSAKTFSNGMSLVLGP